MARSPLEWRERRVDRRYGSLASERMFAGVLSCDRTQRIVGSMQPVLVFTYGLITGAAPLLIVALSALAVVPTLIVRGPLMDALGPGTPPTSRPGR